MILHRWMAWARELSPVMALLAVAASCSAAPGPLARHDGSRPTPPPASSAAGSASAEPGPPPQPVVVHPRAQESPLQLPPLTHHQLPSGLAIDLVTLPQHPLATLELEIGVGGLVDRPGVAELTAGLVAQGAASKHGRTGEFARQVAALGAELELEVEAGVSRFRLTVATDQVTAAIGALGAMVEHRGLRAATYHSLRSRTLSEARSRAGDDPGWLCQETLQRALLGAGKATSRKATLGTYSELSRVRHAHCNQFYATHYRGDRTRLIIATSEPAQQLVKAVEASFGSYPRSTADPVAPTGPPPAVDGQPIYLLNQKDAPRSTVALGWITPVVTPATWPALQVLVGALAAALRQPGSSAEPHASLMPPPHVSLFALPEARFQIVVSTTGPRATTGRLAAALRARLATFVQAPLPPEQIAVLGRQLRTRLAVTADDPGRLVGQAGQLLALGGKPDDWLRLPGRVASLTPATVDELRRSLAPPAVMVVVGDAKPLGPQLTGLGTVRLINGRAGFGTLKTLPAAQPRGGSQGKGAMTTMSP